MSDNHEQIVRTLDDISTKGNLPALRPEVNTTIEASEKEGREINMLNMANAAMEALPDALAAKSYEALQQWYEVMVAGDKIRWKVKCAVLCEAWYRIKAHTDYGQQTEALNQLAQDFGIRKSSAYDKIRMWETFWQEPDEQARVIPNGNIWKFEDHQNGINWFRIALRASDPIEAINMAQEKHDMAVAEEGEYTAQMFSREIQCDTKPEKDRLANTKRLVEKTAKAVEELTTGDDVSHEFVSSLSEGLHHAANALDRITGEVADGTYAGEVVTTAEPSKTELKPAEAGTVEELTDMLEVCSLASSTLIEGGNFKTDKLEMAVSRVSRAAPSMVKTLREAIEAEQKAS